MVPIASLQHFTYHISGSIYTIVLKNYLLNNWGYVLVKILPVYYSFDNFTGVIIRFVSPAMTKFWNAPGYCQRNLLPVCLCLPYKKYALLLLY